jgi:hypothetical protein
MAVERRNEEIIEDAGVWQWHRTLVFGSDERRDFRILECPQSRTQSSCHDGGVRPRTNGPCREGMTAASEGSRS